MNDVVGPRSGPLFVPSKDPIAEEFGTSFVNSVTVVKMRINR
jgi:hypothetical protein